MTLKKTMVIGDNTVVAEDKAYVYVANTPANTTANRTVVLWHEDVSKLEDRHGIYQPPTTDDMEAVRNQFTQNFGSSGHVNPYEIKWLRASDGTHTLDEFFKLKDAGILVASTHGLPGLVFVTGFPLSDANAEAKALAWANAINASGGGDYATNRYSSGQYHAAWFVEVKTSYFKNHWKSVRDANRAVLLTATCHSADGVSENQPSFIDSVGGAFSRGREGEDSASTTTTTHRAIIESMRTSGWRTVLGGHMMLVAPNAGDTFRGHGKITLWPAPVRSKKTNGDPAAFPVETMTNGIGVVTVVLDTMVGKVSQSMQQYLIEAPLNWTDNLGWLPPFGDQRYGNAFRRPFGNAQSATVRVNGQYAKSRGSALFMSADGVGYRELIRLQWSF